ncbi:MAG: hypothetical protein HZB33_14090 [Nitrospirae bacterium]|nr:hypothetical protein [Nitrospirota bacterium]
MKNGLLTRFERIMVAAAFAEEAEFETARMIMSEGKRPAGRATQRPQARKQQSIRKAN